METVTITLKAYEGIKVSYANHLSERADTLSWEALLAAILLDLFVLPQWEMGT